MMRAASEVGPCALADPVARLDSVALEELAYEEAKRAIDRQSGALDGLRSRAGILLAAVSVSTSFFGGLALRDDLSRWATLAAWIATIAALAAGGFGVAILWPRAAWAFNVSPSLFGRQLARAPDEATAYRELALRLEENYKANERRLAGGRGGLYRTNARRLLGYRIAFSRSSAGHASRSPSRQSHGSSSSPSSIRSYARRHPPRATSRKRRPRSPRRQASRILGPDRCGRTSRCPRRVAAIATTSSSSNRALTSRRWSS